MPEAEHEITEPPPAGKNRYARFLLRHGKKPLVYGLGIALFLLLATPLLTYAYFIRDMASKSSIISRKNSGVVLTDRSGTPFFTFYEARTKKTATLAQIPDSMENAVIVSEDKDFYNHPGFSLRGILRSFLVNLREERISQGGSTISQQLVKNTLLSQNRNLLRKYQEIILAMELERRYQKEEILEMYLNTIYFGEGAFGIEDAAHTYFNKTSSELTIGESALLAGILPAPSAFSPLTGDRSQAFRRRDLILTLMRENGYITASEEQQAKNTAITFNPADDGLNQTAPHFALMVKNELIKQYGEQRVARSGFTVKTTLNLDYQIFAENTVRNQVGRLAGQSVSNGAAVALDPKTGEVLVLVGSADWNNETNGKINMALRPRQPGSSFKPFVYAKGFESRLLTPATLIEDKETTFPGGYKLKNYDNRYRGNVAVRRALANSLNIPAVKALDMVGVSQAIDMANRLGITTLSNDSSRYGLSLVLGAGEVPLLEMTRAYGVFANAGTKAETVTILEIRDKNNNKIFEHRPQTETILDPGVAFLSSPNWCSTG